MVIVVNAKAVTVVAVLGRVFHEKKMITKHRLRYLPHRFGSQQRMSINEA